MKRKTMIIGGIVLLIGIFFEVFNIIPEPSINYGFIISGILLILFGFFINKKECSNKVQDKEVTPLKKKVIKK